MNIIDILLQLITWLAQNLLLPLLPSEAASYPLSTLQTLLAGIQSTITSIFGGWGVIIPMGLVFIFLGVVITAELTLFGFGIVKYILGFFKRS